MRLRPARVELYDAVPHAFCVLLAEEFGCPRLPHLLTLSELAIRRGDTDVGNVVHIALFVEAILAHHLVIHVLVLGKLVIVERRRVNQGCFIPLVLASFEHQTQ